MPLPGAAWSRRLSWEHGARGTREWATETPFTFRAVICSERKQQYGKLSRKCSSFMFNKVHFLEMYSHLLELSNYLHCKCWYPKLQPPLQNSVGFTFGRHYSYFYLPDRKLWFLCLCLSWFYQSYCLHLLTSVTNESIIFLNEDIVLLAKAVKKT